MMRRHSRIKRILSLLLTFLMILSLAPATVLAASDTYQKVTDQGVLHHGKIHSGDGYRFCAGCAGRHWLSAVEFGTDIGDTIQNRTGAVWDITVDGEQAVLTDGNGVSVAPKGGNNNGIKTGRIPVEMGLCKWEIYLFRSGEGYRHSGQQYRCTIC